MFQAKEERDLRQEKGDLFEKWKKTGVQQERRREAGNILGKIPGPDPLGPCKS